VQKRERREREKGEKDTRREKSKRDREEERNQETRKFRGRNLVARGSSRRTKKSGRRTAVELKTMIS